MPKRRKRPLQAPSVALAPFLQLIFRRGDATLLVRVLGINHFCKTNRYLHFLVGSAIAECPRPYEIWRAPLETDLGAHR
jgi:hypothetical protein